MTEKQKKKKKKKKKKKTVVVPEDFTPKEAQSEGPFFAAVTWDGELVSSWDKGADGRDVSQPVGQDEQGNPVYAPRGPRFRLW